VTLTYDLLTFGDVWWIKLRISSAHTNFLPSYNYPFPSYVWLNLITLPSPGTVTAYVPCHVTYHRGQKLSTFLKSLNPIYLFTVTFTVIRRRLSHVIGENSVFLLWSLHSWLRMRSITWPVHRGSPKTPHVPIFWPRIVYSLYNFYGATMTIKGSFILEHPHVKAVFGWKKLSSQNRSPKWRFFGNLRV